MKPGIVIVASLLASTSIVHAQPSLTDPVPQPAETAPLLPNYAPRSPHHAVALAAAGTLASLAVTGLGLMLTLGNHGEGYGSTGDFVAVMALVGGPVSLVATPSLGHLYGEERLGTPAVYVRTAGLAIMVGGLVLDLADNLGNAFCIPDEGPCLANNDRGFVVVGVGGAVMLAGAIYDIATSASATESYNAKRSSIHLVPTAIRTLNNSTVAGIGLAASF